jgi:hypothetical protein
VFSLLYTVFGFFTIASRSILFAMASFMLLRDACIVHAIQLWPGLASMLWYTWGVLISLIVVFRSLVFLYVCLFRVHGLIRVWCVVKVLNGSCDIFSHMPVYFLRFAQGLVCGQGLERNSYLLNFVVIHIWYFIAIWNQWTSCLRKSCFVNVSVVTWSGAFPPQGWRFLKSCRHSSTYKRPLVNGCSF